ncbi:MAG: hypothetical protein NVSMB27_30370 [Ktedonobacteraceae bacterium]
MSKSEHVSETNRQLWKVDEPCCELTFGCQTCAIQLEAEIEKEPYQTHTAAREFVPLTVSSGMRNRVIVRFYTSLPEDSMAKGMRHQRIGEGQAWFYQEDRILLLWRCNLLERYKATNSEENQNLHRLWQEFEQFLLRHFPETTWILTPSWNRPYDQSLWLQFIKKQGFIHPSPAGIPNAAFIKSVKKTL